MKYISLLILCAACAGVETGNPPAALVATSSTVSVGIGAGDLRVREVWAGVRGVRLVRESGCDTPDERGADVALEEGAVDLLASRTVELPNQGALLCGLNVSLVAAEERPPGAPEELASSALVVVAERASDGAEVRIAARDSGTFRLRREPEQPAFLLTGAHLIAFDVGRFVNFDPELLDLGDDGVARIDARNNSVVWNALPSLQESVLSFHDDANENRRLDEDERFPSLAKAE